jgi:hypothetical protein
MPPDAYSALLIRYRPQSSENPLQLRLAHFFLWTAATAVALLLLRPTFPAVPEGAPAVDAAEGVRDLKDVLRAGVAVAVAPVYGAALMAFAIGVWRTMRGKGPLDVCQPGHWFLLIVGSAFLGAGFSGIAINSADNLMEAPMHQTFLTGVSFCIAMILCVVSPLLLLLAVLEIQEPPRWKIVFRLFGVAIVSALFGCPCMVSLSMFAVVLLLHAGLLVTFCGAMLAAVLIDLYQRERRDVAHWLGVLSVVTVVMHLVALAMV